MTYKEMRSVVMTRLAKRSVKKRHRGMTEEEISEYYSKLRRGKKVWKSAQTTRRPVAK